MAAGNNRRAPAHTRLGAAAVCALWPVLLPLRLMPLPSPLPLLLAAAAAAVVVVVLLVLVLLVLTLVDVCCVSSRVQERRCSSAGALVTLPLQSPERGAPLLCVRVSPVGTRRRAEECP